MWEQEACKQEGTPGSFAKQLANPASRPLLARISLRSRSLQSPEPPLGGRLLCGFHQMLWAAERAGLRCGFGRWHQEAPWKGSRQRATVPY